MIETHPASKIWLETDEGYVFGPGIYNLLLVIQEKGTLKEASQKLDMSYRYAWGLIKKAEKKLGSPLINATKGGRQGGGSSRITNLGESYIKDFEKIQKTWQAFKNQYVNSVETEANVLNNENQLVLKIDNEIVFPKKNDINIGDKVVVQVLLKNIKAI